MVATKIWVNIGSGNGLLPDGTKPLPEPMLTDHKWSQVTFILGLFHMRCLNHQSLKSVFENYMSKISFIFPRGQWVNHKRGQLLLAVLCTDFFCYHYSLWIAWLHWKNLTLKVSWNFLRCRKQFLMASSVQRKIYEIVNSERNWGKKTIQVDNQHCVC